MADRPLGFAPRLLPEPQAAAYLGIGTTKLRELALPRRNLGGKKLYDRIDLDAFADSLDSDGPREELNGW